MCRDNGIEYYMTAGSLMGAVRHQGFIPWDDDADVIMTRKNWEKFYELSKTNLPDGLILNTQYDNIDLAMTANHLTETATTELYRYHVSHPEVLGVLLDIIIMDPVPEGEEARTEYIETVTRHMELTNFQYQYALRQGHKVDFARHWKDIEKRGKKTVIEELSKKAFGYSEEESRYYVQRFAGSPHFWPKEIFGKPKYVPFEDTELPVPERAEDCLVIGFDDDWMYIPQGGAEKSTHEFNVRNFNLPSTMIAKDFEDVINRKELDAMFLKRKYLWDEHANERVDIEIDLDVFAISRIKKIYEERMQTGDLSRLIEARDYEGLETFFSEFLEIQCQGKMLGSSSLTGWRLWYRKCNPLLIDIGDEGLYGVLLLLFHKEKLAPIAKILKARKSVNREMSEGVKELNDLYTDLAKAISAYQNQEYDESRTLIDRWLDKYPDNYFLWLSDLRLKIQSGLTTDEIMRLADAALEEYGAYPDILLIKAQGYLKNGQTAEAISIFHELTETNHGIVLLNVRLTLEKMMEENPQDEELYDLWVKVKEKTGVDFENEEDFDGDSSDSDSDDEDSDQDTDNDRTEIDDNDEVDDDFDSDYSALSESRVLQKRFELLVEIDHICRKYSIKYFLMGKTFFQAKRCNEFVDGNSDLAVLMDTENAEKFIEAVRKENAPDRYIDSMLVSRDFHRFCLHYGDKNTLDFRPTLQHSCPGIHVTIEILRFEKQGKMGNTYDRILETGWEALSRTSTIGRRVKLYKAYVNLLCHILGKKRLSRRLYKRFMASSGKRKKNRYFRKMYNGKRRFYPAYWFDFQEDVELNGHMFKGMKFADKYLKKIYGQNWEERPIPKANPDSLRRILDTSMGYEDYLKYLNDHNINPKKQWKRWRKSNNANGPVRSLNGKIKKYWFILCASNERYLLAEQFQPQKEELMELYRSGQDELLIEKMEPYTEIVLLYLRKMISLGVDPELDMLSTYCLFRIDRAGMARRNKELLESMKWNRISLYEGNGVQTNESSRE